MHLPVGIPRVAIPSVPIFWYCTDYRHGLLHAKNKLVSTGAKLYFSTFSLYIGAIGVLTVPCVEIIGILPLGLSLLLLFD